MATTTKTAPRGRRSLGDTIALLVGSAGAGLQAYGGVRQRQQQEAAELDAREQVARLASDDRQATLRERTLQADEDRRTREQLAREGHEARAAEREDERAWRGTQADQNRKLQEQIARLRTDTSRDIAETRATRTGSGSRGTSGTSGGNSRAIALLNRQISDARGQIGAAERQLPKRNANAAMARDPDFANEPFVKAADAAFRADSTRADHALGLPTMRGRLANLQQTRGDLAYDEAAADGGADAPPPAPAAGPASPAAPAVPEGTHGRATMGAYQREAAALAAKRTAALQRGHPADAVRAAYEEDLRELTARYGMGR